MCLLLAALLRSSSAGSAASSTVAVSPLLSAVEAAARKWAVQSRVNPNRVDVEGNVDFAFSLLRLAHRMETVNERAERSLNVVLDPIAVAARLHEEPDNVRRALFDALEPAERERAMRHIEGGEHSILRQALLQSNNDFAVFSTRPHSSDAAPTSSFQGYLAPRFALTRTASPSWFIPTATAKQISSFVPPARSTLTAEDTAVTPLERSLRVPARMLYRTGRLWYVETREWQMVDVPYLHPHFSLTLISPRFSNEPTIENHPISLLYPTLHRCTANIHQLVAALDSRQWLHATTHQTLMSGLLLLPSFDARYSLHLPTSSTNKSQRRSLSASLHLSGAGLGEGGLKNLASRPERPLPHFLLSLHRPFLAMVRHRPTNAVALIAKIEQVEVDQREYTYKQRRVQWLEDRRPIPQFIE